MHFVSIHVYIIGSKFGGKILMFTEVMSCTIFVASTTGNKYSLLATNIVQLITSIDMHSSGTHRRWNQGALAPTKFISVHRNLVFTIKMCLVS